MLIGFTAVLFEVDWLKNFGLGWPCILVGFTLIAAAIIAQWSQSRRSSKPDPSIRSSRAFARPAEAPFDDSAPALVSSKSISFVAPAAPAEIASSSSDVVVKTLIPDIVNVRFLAYRCEISEQALRAIYQNGTQRELRWYEISAITIRQMPNQEPWDGKLILDVVPNALSTEKPKPIRISSTTFVNYSALPQGQAASTRENLRRLAVFALTRYRLIFLDPGTDYFVHAGQPPVRFVSMAQFTEYDSQY